MEQFNPDQSLIPAVGGSITPMSGGGSLSFDQMGGAGETLFDQKVEFFNETQIKALIKLAPVTCKNTTPDNFSENFINLSEKEYQIKKEIHTSIHNIPKTISITSAKKPTLGPKGMKEIMEYLSNRCEL